MSGNPMVVADSKNNHKNQSLPELTTTTSTTTAAVPNDDDDNTTNPASEPAQRRHDQKEGGVGAWISNAFFEVIDFRWLSRRKEAAKSNRVRNFIVNGEWDTKAAPAPPGDAGPVKKKNQNKHDTFSSSS